MSKATRRGAQRRKHSEPPAAADAPPPPTMLVGAEAEQVLIIATTAIGAYRGRANLLGGAMPEKIAEIVVGRFVAADGSWCMPAFAVVRRRAS